MLFRSKFATSKPEIACDIVDMEAYAIAKTCLKEEVSHMYQGMDLKKYY